ncbi:MAG: transposase, partial [Anaerolineae bacterium]
MAIGLHLRRLRLLEPIFQKVRIAQKTVKFSPVEKLIDALITILAGAHGLVEANKRVRPDLGLQRAFGRSGCAEQSVIQDTLDACVAENVQQMEEAVALIYRQHSQGYRHPDNRKWQLLDIDLTGRPCGPKAAFATPGYFSRQRNRRGRQVGYVLATLYEEVVVEKVFPGKEQLNTALG